MSRKRMLQIAIIAVAAYLIWMWWKSRQAGVVAQPSQQPDPNAALPIGDRHGAVPLPGSATDPSGSLIGSGIPFGPADPTASMPDVYGPAFPDGSLYT